MAYGAAVIPLAYAYAFGFSSHSAAQVTCCEPQLRGPCFVAHSLWALPGVLSGFPSQTLVQLAVQ